MVVKRHATLNPASGTSADEQTERAVEHIRERLEIGDPATPDDVEWLVDSPDKGEFDHLFEQSVAANARPLVQRQFADVKPYSDEAWKNRHRATD